jgi:hypothetical protein
VLDAAHPSRRFGRRLAPIALALTSFVAPHLAVGAPTWVGSDADPVVRARAAMRRVNGQGGAGQGGAGQGGAGQGGAGPGGAGPGGGGSAPAPGGEYSVPPSSASPPVVSDGITTKPARQAGTSLVGVGRALAQPRFEDRRRRIPLTQRPADFGHTLRPGEHFRFDVTFAGNPAGLAEASIVGVEPDPRGGPPAGAPRIRMEGHARTSGVVSVIATVTDDMVTYVDAHSGAALTSENILHYSGWAPRKYKHRVTAQTYEGRGQVRIVDTKDDRASKKLSRVPIDTFDPLSAMAWVRSLDLEAGETVKAHVIDGTTLLRIEIHGKGVMRLDDMPSIGVALGLGHEAHRIDGTITRVDRWDQAVPGKRTFKLRAWLSNDERKIPLVMESDMWVGAIRLVLTAYDPPQEKSAPRVGMPAPP